MDVHIDATIRFEHESTFKQLIAQCQPHCAFMLCIKNNNTLMCYHNKNQLPTSLTLLNNNTTVYCFVDDQKNEYCVFGRAAADTMCPHFDKPPTKAPTLIEFIGHSDDTITIEHDGKTYTFPKSHPLLEMKTIHLFG